MKHRNPLYLALFGVISALALAACGGGASEQTAGPAASSTDLPPICEAVLQRVERHMAKGARPTRSRPVVVAGVQDLNGGMNALATTDYVAAQHQRHLNLMTLVRFDDAFELQPYLAESWSLDSSGTELTFVLRPDVDWHDGRPTTAYDVAFTFDRLRDPDTGFPRAREFGRFESVEVVDSLTVRFRIKPHEQAVSRWRTVPILPRHMLEGVRAQDLVDHPFGTRCPLGNGPYRFVDMRPGDRWHFEANPHFPAELGGPPPIQRYTYRVIPDENALALEFEAGAIDLMVVASPELGARVANTTSGRVASVPSQQTTFVAWNGRRPPLSDRQVRHALTLGTDRQALVDSVLAGYGRIAQTAVPEAHWAHDSGAGLGYDPARARRLLAEAGWVDRNGDGIREDAMGRPLRIELLANRENRLRVEVAERVGRQIAALGVDVTVDQPGWQELLDRITGPEKRTFDGVVMGWSHELEIDETPFFHSDQISGPLAWAGLVDLTVDDLLEGLAQAPTREEAAPLWRAYQRQIVAAQPYTYAFSQDRLIGLSDRVVEAPMDARGAWAQIRQWRTMDGAPAVATR